MSEVAGLSSIKAKTDTKTCIIVALLAAAIAFYGGVKYERSDLVKVQTLVAHLQPTVAVQTSQTVPAASGGATSPKLP